MVTLLNNNKNNNIIFIIRYQLPLKIASSNNVVAYFLKLFRRFIHTLSLDFFFFAGKYPTK